MDIDSERGTAILLRALKPLGLDERNTPNLWAKVRAQRNQRKVDLLHNDDFYNWQPPTKGTSLTPGGEGNRAATAEVRPVSHLSSISDHHMS